jgi:hypothetical protein
MQSSIERPGMPVVYNLLTDPKEQYDIFEFGGEDGVSASYAPSLSD